MPPPPPFPPPGAWDTHIHIIDPRFPIVANPTYRPPVATVGDYRAVQQRLGLSRVLVVQSVLHGSGHACLLDALHALGPTARGIAMVEPGVALPELHHLARHGIRGARFLMLPGGLVSWAEITPLAARIQAVGWHANLQLDGDTLPDREPAIAALPGTVVIDHMGLFRRPTPPDHPNVAALLRLIDTGRIWVKLSAPNAGGQMGPPPYPAAGTLARALIRHAPERMMWGTDWPHTHTTQVRNEPPEDDATLLNLLHDWTDDRTTLKRILVDTPEALFGG